MLPAELYQQVRQLHIRTRRLVDGAFAGHYPSVFKGRGLEFADVREYVPGDDVRMIDWNVTARMGQPFVKEFVEERELSVMVLLDVSASGRFGSAAKLKSQIAAETAAVLALTVLRNNDRVGLILFSDRVESFQPPQKGRNKAVRLIRELLGFEPQGTGTDIGHALDYLSKVVPQRTVSFLLSDFLTTGYQHALRRINNRHEIIPVVIEDPREAELPSLGLIQLRDLESGREVLVDSSNAKVRARYRQRRAQAVAQRQLEFQGLGIDSVEVRTDQSVIYPLLRFMRRRELRR